MTDEIADTFDAYDGPVIVSVSSEIGETRIALHQNGKWITFSGEVLDRIMKARADFEVMANISLRLFVARCGGEGREQ